MTPAISVTFFARGVQNGGYLVIYAVFLDGAAAVDKHDVRAVFRELVREPLKRIGAEVNLGWVVVREGSEHMVVPLILWACLIE